MKYCMQCGAPVEDNSEYCANCGARQSVVAAGDNPAPEALSPANNAAPVPPLSQSTFSQTPQPFKGISAQRQPSKKSRKAVPFAILIIAFIAAACIGAYLLFFQEPTTLPGINYSYLTDEEHIDLSYKAVDVIYPTLYDTLDSIINFTATCEGGEAKVLVSVEIPGFTQPYEQLITLSEQITQIYVRPPILTGELTLNTQKKAQIVFTVTNEDTGACVLQETVPITIMSKYDFQLWNDEFGVCTYDNLLAWLTPESDGVLQLQREAVDWLTDFTAGQINSLGGYQNIGGFADDELFLNTYYQALAIQAALGGIAEVRYNNASFSVGGADIQRIKTPDEVLATKSGICVETSLVVASALQSAGMHAMIILPPGHAQVAVETWEGSGEYFLIETTYLPLDTTTIDQAVLYLTNDEWDSYIQDPYGYGDGYGCYVLDCSLIGTYGLSSFSN